MSAPTSKQPQRKSARIKNTQKKVNEAALKVDAQKVLPESNKSRKKQKVAETPPSPEVVDLADDDSEVDELPSVTSRGSLSKLLDISLDVLLEIFTHIMPGDLLNVARTNKSFSQLLLSRRSIFIWRATLDNAGLGGYPPKPDDWTELAWVQLVSGSKACTVCGKRTTLDVWWAFRKRLCKACRDKHVIYYNDRRGQANHKLRDTGRDIRTILPTCERAYLWFPDVVSYHRQLEKLSSKHRTETSLFLVKREELDTQMVERTRPVLEHAQLCEEGAILFKQGQVADKEERTIHRVTQIYERLLGLGFEAADLEEPIIRHHKDVDNPRVLTKEVWERLKPTLIEVAGKAKKTRLEREMNERLKEREKVVIIEYRTFLKRIAPSAVSFMPSVAELLRFPKVCAALAKDQGATDSLHKSVTKALVASMPEFSEFITARIDAFRKEMPESWPVARLDEGASSVLDTSSEPAAQHELKLHPSIANLDLAAYTFRCGHRTTSYGVVYKCQESGVNYGLDMLAHPCRLRGLSEHQFKPHPVYHRAVLRVLELLQLDPASTTVTMLDNLDPAFVDSSSFNQTWYGPQGYTLMTWREAVERLKPFDGHPTRSCIRLLTQSECRWFNTTVIDNGGRLSRISEDAKYRTPVECLPVWGCMHCSAHLEPGLNESLPCSSYFEGWPSYSKSNGSQSDDPWRWFTFPQVRAHLVDIHKIVSHCDGQDYFINRHVSRQVHTRFPSVPAKLSVGESSQFA